MKLKYFYHQDLRCCPFSIRLYVKYKCPEAFWLILEFILLRNLLFFDIKNVFEWNE